MAAKHDFNIKTINEMFESGFRIQPDIAGFELIDRVFALRMDSTLEHDSNQAICSIVQHNQDVIAAHPKFVSLLHDVLGMSSDSSSVPLAMALISLVPDIECLYSFDHRKIEFTPLQYAVLHNSHVDIIKELLSKGADPNRMCPTGSASPDTLLTLSINMIHRDRLAVVSALLDHDSDPNIVSPARGTYPLFICLKLLSGRNDESMITTIVKCLDILLKAGAKVNQPIKSYLERAPICANPGKYYKIIGVCGLITFQPAYDTGQYSIRDNLSIIELLVDAGTIPHEVEHMSRSLLDQYKHCLNYPELYNITGASKYFVYCVMKLLEAGFDLYFHGNTVTSLPTCCRDVKVLRKTESKYCTRYDAICKYCFLNQCQPSAAKNAVQVGFSLYPCLGFYIRQCMPPEDCTSDFTIAATTHSQAVFGTFTPRNGRTIGCTLLR